MVQLLCIPTLITGIHLLIAAVTLVPDGGHVSYEGDVPIFSLELAFVTLLLFHISYGQIV